MRLLPHGPIRAKQTPSSGLKKSHFHIRSWILLNSDIADGEMIEIQDADGVADQSVAEKGTSLYH
jgi:hypothetical protein